MHNALGLIPRTIKKKRKEGKNDRFTVKKGNEGQGKEGMLINLRKYFLQGSKMTVIQLYKKRIKQGLEKWLSR